MPKPDHLISYCISNVDNQVLVHFRLRSDSFFEDHCLQRCGECYDGPFLLLDEQLYTGKNHDEILEAIKRDTGAS